MFAWRLNEMIPIEKIQQASQFKLKHKNYSDWKKVMECYDKFDVAAKDKNFDYCARLEREIKTLHERNGMTET